MDLILNSALKYSSKLQLLEPIRWQNLYENNHIDKNLLQAVKQLRESNSRLMKNQNLLFSTSNKIILYETKSQYLDKTLT